MYVTELFFYCAVAMFVTGCIVAGNMISNIEERN